MPVLLNGPPAANPKQQSWRAGLLVAAVWFGWSGTAHAEGILTQRGATPAPVASGVAANLVAQQQAAAVAAQSQNQLSQIANALRAMQTAQTAARNLTLAAPSTTANGLNLGGLVPDSGLAAPGVARPVTTWVNATTPTQVSAAGRTTVTVNQTAAQAILSWNSFNVGRDTTVDFNQHGNSTWVALNRIAASGVPSQILGAINAPGQVYLIDPNGIIFGGASQVNVGALIASSAAISDSQFTADGIYSAQAGTNYAPSFTAAGAPIIVRAGAEITTAAPAAVTTGGGFVLLMGTTVDNAGAITTPDGQTELAGGDNFLLRPGVGTSTNPTSTTRGNEIAVGLDKKGSSTTGGSGLVTNSGIITADTGDITLAGETVVQNGLLLSTTTVSTRGTIHLLSSASDPFSSVTLTGNSLTLIAPDLASTATALNSQRATLIADSATANQDRNGAATKAFDDLSLQNDQQEESRIEIVTGGAAIFANGAQTVAPGGQVAVSAASRIEAESGAVIDVAGSFAVPLPVASNDLSVNIQNYEQRDDPQNRLTQNLRNSTVYVDARQLSQVAASAADGNVRDYTEGGVLEVSGYVADTGHTIGEWTAIGGTITLATTGTAGAIVAQTGAVFDIAGGSIQYQGGEVPQSYFIGTNGRLYNVNTAPSDITYAGVFDGFNVDHTRWTSTPTVYANVLSDPSQIYEQGYTVGRAAGTLTLSAPTALFDGTIEAGVVNGPQQTASVPAGTADPYLLGQTVVAAPGSLVVSDIGSSSLLPTDTAVSFGATNAAADSLSPTAAIPKNLIGTSDLSAAGLTADGLGGLSVLTDNGVAVTAPLTLAPGATVGLFGSTVTLAADVTAPSGSVSAGNETSLSGTETILVRKTHANPAGKSGPVTLTDGAVIDTAGLWTNLAVDPAGPNDTAFSNGGAVSLVSVANLVLNAGTGIDASAGAVVAANRAETGGVGGNISLIVFATGAVDAAPTGDLILHGQLQSLGVTAGGTLALTAKAFRIADAAPVTGPGTVGLSAALFASGFSGYTLNGAVTVDPGTNIDVVEPTYQFTTASAAVPTGASPLSGLTPVLEPLYVANPQLTKIAQRPGASFTVDTASTGAGFDLGTGAAITVDPKQTIAVTTLGQITIDGDLTAPGGTIDIFNDATYLNQSYKNDKLLSIWIGATSRVDAAARAFSARNAAGDVISVAPAGGSIVIGNANTPGGATLSSTAAVVIVQQGAVLDAAGSAAFDQTTPRSAFGAALDSVGATGVPIPVVGAGGLISLSSENGLYLDGTMTAAAGGPTAAGGTLFLGLETDSVVNAHDVPDAPRVLTISQNAAATALPADLTPGVDNPALVRGSGQISVAQITAGGFGTVQLYARDALLFQGNVRLTAPQAVDLYQGAISDTSGQDSVTIAAPYVLLSGQVLTQSSTILQGANVQSITGYAPANETGTLTVDASLIDVRNAVDFGGVEATIGPHGGTRHADIAGFGTVALNSTGALRFLSIAATGGNGQTATTLITTGNLDLTASIIYAAPASQTSGAADAFVLAGYTPDPTANFGSFRPGKVLTIRGTATKDTAPPPVLGGSLAFVANTILDSGEIWQPLGAIQFGAVVHNPFSGVAVTGDLHGTVELLAGSVTSVSAAGLNIPFGGTTDGISYAVNGSDVAARNSADVGYGLQSVNSAGVNPGTITLSAEQIDVASGAKLDLQGGGDLTGAGFISGEDGSTDVLTTPLLQVGASGGVTQPTLASDPVYAIVAGPQPVVAPSAVDTQTGATGSTPALGEQIVIPAGVPGLPAGRYTLLPAAYALEPGGFRVEFDGAASLAAAPVLALPNGSYAVAGDTAIAHTAVVSSLPVNFTITPAAQVANYAQYDTETYAQFLVAAAAQNGAERPALPEDAGSLDLQFAALRAATLENAGTTDLQAATGGAGGTLQITGFGSNSSIPASFDIYGATPPALGNDAVALSAAAIDAFDPTTLELGIAGQGINSNLFGVTLETGATLTAARVVITALSNGITLDPGSEIDTLGRGTLPTDSTEAGPISDNGASVLDVGNGYISYSTAPGSLTEFGPITIDNGATIYTDGSIAFATGASVNIGVGAVYGGAYLDLAVPEINVGDSSASGATPPPGLTLTSAVLQRLTAGVPGAGVPAVQILVLTASDSLNFFGTTALDLSGGNVQLVINTPAIYGYGAAGDVATVKAGTIVWNGVQTTGSNGQQVNDLPGGVVAGGPGAGTLDFDAKTIVFGYSSLDRPTRDLPLDRLALGFSTVNLNASTEITANNQGALAVYLSQSAYGKPGTGGALNLDTPLLTAANEATMAFTAGGALTVTAPTDVAAATALASNAAGAEIELTGNTVDIASAVILPSGKLDVTAAGDIALKNGALVDLAGDISTILGTTTYGFGGTFIAASTAGTITQADGAGIDVAAVHNTAGAVQFTALAGAVALGGTLTGTSTAGYNSGSFSLRARTLANFAALNAALTSGGFFLSRAFEIGQGDLTISTAVTAKTVDISLDGGSLTVAGPIDASFGSAGTIDLAASDNLIIAAGADLNAAGVTLALDSDGQPIAAANTPEISLTASTGTLTLASGASIDVASADKVARGDVELNVPRLGGDTAGDAKIETASGVNITGAATIAVNAFATYAPTDAAGTIVQDNGGNMPVATGGADDGFVGLDQINAVNQTFMTAAAANADLASRLRGLTTNFAAVFQLRPGVDITSAAPDGNLTVQGDLSLAGFRYGAGVNPAVYGSGAPGVLEICAGGNLNVYGSITDGFYQPINDAGTSYAHGWVLYAGTEPYNHNIVIPIAVTLAAGSSLGTDETVNYAVPTDGGTFQNNAVAPVALTIAGTQRTPVAFVATSDITRNGVVLFAKGQVVPANSRLPNGAIIAAGGAFPFPLTVGPVVWPADTPFTITSNDNGNGIGAVVLAQPLTLQPSAVIPGDSYIIFPNNAASVSTRAIAAGTQGQLYPLAQLLPVGDQSWSIQLVAGADTAAADPGSVQAASALAAAGDAGSITLADAHYGQSEGSPVPGFSVIRTGTGALSLIAGGSITEASDYGVYTAGAEAAPIVDSAGANPYDLAQGLQGPGGTLLGRAYQTLAALVANYQANYPTGGGNVLIAAQGSLNGFISTDFAPNNVFGIDLTDTDAVGSWLWRQGGAGQRGAWWVEFGALEIPPGQLGPFGQVGQQMDGFQGIGTLGGGNLTVAVGGDANALNLAVASTGRVLPDGTVVQTGGGELSVTIGEVLNQTLASGALPDAGGVIADLRGDTTIAAGAIGLVVPTYNFGNTQENDPRFTAPLTTEVGSVSNGVDLLPGDGTVTVQTRGDLVIDGVADPGTVPNEVNTTRFPSTTPASKSPPRPAAKPASRSGRPPPASPSTPPAAMSRRASQPTPPPARTRP